MIYKKQDWFGIWKMRKIDDRRFSFRKQRNIKYLIEKFRRKRKGNIQSSNEEERTMKMRITNRNYQMNEEERRRREENKEKVNRNRQEEERIEADTLRDLTCIFNDQDSPMEL